MINQAEFVNFQGHSYTLLDFSSGLNIIKGRTHSGKSSLVRGLVWAIENKPRGAGDKYKRDFTKPSDPISVSISFEEGTYISREKTTKQNAYLCSSQHEPLVSLRTDVPDEIKEITKLKPHNIQTQKDKYFLIDKTPGQVSSKLNEVVGLKIIDEKATKGKSIISDLSNKLKVLNEQIKETKELLDSEKFSSAEIMSSIMKELDYNIDIFDSETQTLADITDISRQINTHKIQSIRGEEIKTLDRRVKSFRPVVDKLREKEKEVLALLDISNSIGSWNAEYDQAEFVISLEPKVSEIKEELDTIKNTKAIIDTASTIREDIEQNVAEVTFSSNEIERLDEALKWLVSQLDYCTKCGAIKKHWRKEML